MSGGGDIYEETVRQVWHKDGYRYEVGPDPDGLGSVEVRYIEPVGKSKPDLVVRLTMSPEMAERVANNMLALVAEQKGKAT